MDCGYMAYKFCCISGALAKLYKDICMRHCLGDCKTDIMIHVSFRAEYQLSVSFRVHAVQPNSEVSFISIRVQCRLRYFGAK